MTFMSRAHSPTFSSLHLRHSSFSKHFRRFTYVTGHSPTLPLLHIRHSSAHSPSFKSLHLRHSSFSKHFRRFTYVTAYSPTLPLLHIHHSSFSKPSFASPTSQALHFCELASRLCLVSLKIRHNRSSENNCIT